MPGEPDLRARSALTWDAFDEDATVRSAALVAVERTVIARSGVFLLLLLTAAALDVQILAMGFELPAGTWAPVVAAMAVLGAHLAAGRAASFAAHHVHGFAAGRAGRRGLRDRRALVDIGLGFILASLGFVAVAWASERPLPIVVAIAATPGFAWWALQTFGGGIARPDKNFEAVDDAVSAPLRQLAAACGATVRAIRLQPSGVRFGRGAYLINSRDGLDVVIDEDTFRRGLADVRVVFAHELAHHLAGDRARRVRRVSLNFSVAMFLAINVAAAAEPTQTVAALLYTAGAAVALLGVGNALITAASHKAERRADLMSVQLTSADDVVRVLRRLAEGHGAILEGPRWLRLRCDHPTVGARIRAVLDRAERPAQSTPTLIPTGR